MSINIPCPQCGKFPPPVCTCPPLPPGPAEPPKSEAPQPKLRHEIIKMRRGKRGGGREIIILEGFMAGAGVDLEALASDLKRACGTGGTVKGLTIEIQGDHRDAIAEFLLARGFRSKRAGG